MQISALTAATLVAAMLPGSMALPNTRTLRGVSPYKALYHADSLPKEPLHNLAPNKGGVYLATEPHMIEHNMKHRDTYKYHSHPSQRPRWADKVVKKLTKVAERLEKVSGEIGLDFAVVAAALKWMKTKHHPQYVSAGKTNLENLRHIFDHGNTTADTMKNRLPSGSGFDYGNTPVRGVNIGNWLLFELWMDPGLNSYLNDNAQNAPYYGAIIDEWTAGQYMDNGFLTETLNNHFDSWITEDDWKAMAAAGLNHVRIPIPYFAFSDLLGNAPYVPANRFEKLKEGALLAGKYGLKVWIDLHAAAGSQNGFDNSGRSGGIYWPYYPENIAATQNAFTKLVTEFNDPKYAGIVTGIEAINEPQANGNGDVKNLLNSYYPFAWNTVAHPNGQSQSSNLLLVAHDGFLGLGYWQDFWQGHNRDRVLLDKHPYFVYSDQQKREQDTGRLREVCNLSGEIYASTQNYPSIMGEWSISGPNGDNGNDRGFPADQSPVKFPPGPAYPYSVDYMVFMSRNYATQVQTYEYNASVSVVPAG